MVVLGRKPRGSNGYVMLSAFLPDRRMAVTLGAKVAARIRPFVGAVRVSVEFDHTAARRFCYGILDRPFDVRLRLRWSRKLKADPIWFFSYVPRVGAASLRTVLVRRRRLVAYLINRVDATGSFVARRVLNVQAGQAYHDTLISHGLDDRRRASLAYTAHMLEAAADTYVKLGIRFIYLKAGLSAGGRLWPKYGFLPVNSREWNGCRATILSNLAGLPGHIRDTHGPLILKWATDPDPTCMRLIYNLQTPVPDPDRPMLTRRLGPVLLTGTRWEGVLDLSEPSSRRIFRNAVASDLARARSTITLR